MITSGGGSSLRGGPVSVSGAIEVAVGLVFTYFVFSSICSGINEGFARILNSRGTQLFQTINGLIGDLDQIEAFWNHDLIASLSKARSKAGTQQAAIQALTDKVTKTTDGSIKSSSGRGLTNFRKRRVLPSYISPATVVTVMREVAETVPAAPAVQAPEAAAAAPAAQAPTGFLGVLASFDTVLPHDEQRLQAALEKWFNDAMDRLSGWYKRFVQIISVAPGGRCHARLQREHNPCRRRTVAPTNAPG